MQNMTKDEMPAPPNLGATVIVACKNEEANIERCIREIARVLPRAEIMIVAGGTDRTADIAEELMAELPQIRVIRNKDDKGKGHAIKAGIAAASASIMAQFDCDLQFMAEDLPSLLAPIEQGKCDVTFGSRFLKSSDRAGYQPVFFRDAGNRLLAIFTSALIGRRVTDVTAGMKAWTREAIEKIDFIDDKYSYEVEIVVRAAKLGLRFSEVPVQYASRTEGDSMHRNSWAVIKAGLVIIAKSLAARLR
jgi:dolichol-phosphate mannosyltransferase